MPEHGAKASEGDRSTLQEGLLWIHTTALPKLDAPDVYGPGALLVCAETETETEAETGSVIEIEIGDEDRDRD